jgi:hypothetical protein
MSVTTEPIEEMVGGIYAAMRQGTIKSLLESLSREFEPGLSFPSNMPSRVVRLND